MADHKKKKAKSHTSAASAPVKTEEKKPTAFSDAKKKAEAIVKNKQPKTKAKTEKKKGNPVVRYLREMRSELKKVVWPGRKKVFNNTAVVLGALAVFGVILWGVDTGFAALFRLIIGGIGAA